MRFPKDPEFGPRQHNTASRGGNVFANQGEGQMDVHQYNSTINNINAKHHRWTGWAILVLLVADVGSFVYGSSAYTGGRDTTGDGIRAFAMLFLLGVTINLIRRWFRQRL
jgi:hypothetical protein